jgi:peptidoglycan hydrolase-like protein with peptidoglycan-binding domain
VRKNTQRFVQHCSARVVARVALFALVLVASFGCKCADDHDDKGRDFIADTFTDPNKAAQDVSKAADVAAVVLWNRTWESVDFFVKVPTQLKQYEGMGNDAVLAHTQEIVALVDDAVPHADNIIDGLSELRAMGIRVNPGVTRFAREAIQKGRSRLSSTRYTKAKDRAEFWSFLSAFSERIAKANELFSKLDEGKNKLQTLDMTLASMEDARLPYEVNNATITAALKLYKETDAYKESGIPLEIRVPVEIPVGLDKGAHGPAVAMLQTALIDLGFLHPDAGQEISESEFGNKTERALMDFYRAFFPPVGLSQEKILDFNSVLEAIIESLNEFNKMLFKETLCAEFGFTLRKGLRGPDVKRLQEKLILLEDLPEGENDGKYGTGTEKAVKKLQRRMIEESGPWIVNASRFGRIDAFTCEFILKDEDEESESEYGCGSGARFIQRAP